MYFTSLKKIEVSRAFPLTQLSLVFVYPFAFIFLPRLCSNVSSTKKPTVLDHKREEEAWEGGCALPLAMTTLPDLEDDDTLKSLSHVRVASTRNAEQTAFLPTHKILPSNKVEAFCQEGLEKSVEKGAKTDRMS